ncbi:hypothetical protein BUALT_Bualt03G0010200 [Buddleja alternifolia]|uniref:Argonaute 2 n=1 Tax=Buddleja alternifolia TaxID=168488 RepID=A0AAV6XRH2_9LAMI|nr:hypothetical protein BUALT_Bualt03G0010200 [Buddleja alternifolia]
MNELKLSKLEKYLSGKVPYVPRDILQGMDLVMKENPSRYRVSIDRNFYPTSFKVEDDFRNGIAAYRGFQSSLRPTSQGLALCLDSSVLAFRKPLAVIEYLKENIPEFDGVYLDLNSRQKVTNTLKGLAVRVTHRLTKQKFSIAGLTAKTTCDLWFDFVDPKGKDPTVKVSLVEYFREKYGKDIAYQGMPCLILGRNNRTNHVALEFCILVEGQRYRKELLDDVSQEILKKKSLAWPPERRKTISEMMQAHDELAIRTVLKRDVAQNFGLRIDKNMTIVEGRVIGPPDLRLGAPDGTVDIIRVENEKRQWNLAENSVVLRTKDFIKNMTNGSGSLGIRMEEPLICRFAEKHHGYKYLKRMSETRIGVVTQCCLFIHANRGDDKFFGNLCLKINAKLGGISKKSTTPSIAAVVSSINWPAVNRYAARVCPQDHRTERILEFGPMCQDLINTYFQLNKVNPKKIVIFRDGVSEGQFDMVLNEKLSDLKNAVYDDNSKPALTLVVAQKRHQTRLFLENFGEGGPTGNVPPGTVVDTKIVHPFEFDFYLCSHYRRIGTSKAVRYCVLWNQNSFTSDQLQELIYNLCFTFARSTRPVSLVPPVYYADLVAYRGRIFQEVAKEFQSHTVPSNSTTQFDQSFYKLHPDLQNIMFFNQSNQGGGRGRGAHHQPPAQQEWGNRPPVQANQPPAQQAWVDRPPVQSNQPPAQQAWGNRPSVQANQPPTQQAWVNRPPVQGNQPPAQQAWRYRPPQTPPPQVQQPHPQGGVPTGGRVNAWTVRPQGQSAPSPPPSPVQPLPSAAGIDHLILFLPISILILLFLSADELDIQKLKISDQELPSSSSESKGNQIQPIKRPDHGGTVAIKTVKLHVNHFPVKFDPKRTIIHYDVDVKPAPSTDRRPMKRTVRKSDLRVIRDKLFSDDPRFDILQTAYDGEKNIFSAVKLPTGEFQVNLADDEGAKSGSYIFTIKFVNELKLSKLKDYLRGSLSYSPRDILQGMDLVMKENPSGRRICVGRSFYSPEYMTDFDLNNGVAAYQGFQQSLKPTSQGLALCLDYSVLTFRKPWPVIEFLTEHLERFGGVNDVKSRRRDVNNALKGLKVRVIHRRTKQKYTIAGLTEEDARDCYFDLVDPEGNNPPQRISLVRYFQDKWNRNIMHQNVPCLELGKNNRSNKVPIEFCVLVEGQRYPKEYLDDDRALFLKDLTLAKPWVRKRTINEMVQAEDGPCGAVSRNFGIEVDVNMTNVVGRVISAPELKLGGPNPVRVDADKRQWNLLGKSFVDAKSVDRWALLEFTDGDRKKKLQVNEFINNLMGRCRNLGIRMEVPLLHRVTRMYEFSSVNRLENLLKNVVEESTRLAKGKLQLIVCVMTKKDPGYKFLKWVSETRIGVVTQCCLSGQANKPKGQDQYFSNLCLKINVKLGGSNFVLNGKLPHFDIGDDVMFIGADVNHPGAMNASCPSIAAVVGTVNWPAANRYAARVAPQAHRTEKIINFGTMCADLVNTYAQLNRVKPRKIVVFRDGVSDGQFGMLLEEELLDLKKAIYDNHYQPTITLIVAQKRHQTRLFIENRHDGGASGNVPPGTVVDTKIVHPFDFDFYLCSHYGSLGTSKPTHYYVLWDENGFKSDLLQKLIYDMCFTFARCTKPVSLVPPVYYADLVAYRGRMFQEALMESTRGSSPSNVSFDPSLYSMHSDLENIMFFV